MDMYIKICFKFLVLTSVCMSVALSAGSDLNHGEESNSNYFQQQSVLDHLTETQLKRLLKQLTGIKNSASSSCSNQFGNLESKIIRAKDSLRNGAVFLSGVSGIKSPQACREKCCNYNLNSSAQNKCDAAVFHVDADTDDESVCYLFSCFNVSNGEFSCLFYKNDNFVTYSRNHGREFVHYLHKTVKPTLQQTTQKPIDTSAKTVAKTTTILTTTAQQVPIVKQHETLCNTKCTRFEWSCNNHCCISVHQVCDGIPHCQDRSDEVGCPTDSKKPVQSLEESLQQLSKTLNSTQISHIPDTNQDKPKSLSDAKTLKTEVVVDNTQKQVVALKEKDEEVSPVNPEAGAVLPLAIGLAVTAAVLLMVACRVRVMKNKLRRRGKPLAMDESDYLINGMYL